eukprot:2779683-Rhodomonas_salina.2
MLANHRSSAPLPVLLTQFHAHNFSFADEEEAEEEEEEDKWREGGPAAYWAVESTPVSLDTLLLLAHPSSSSSSSSSSAVWDAVVKKGGIGGGIGGGGGGIGGGGGVVYLSPDAPLALAPQDRFQRGGRQGGRGVGRGGADGEQQQPRARCCDTRAHMVCGHTDTRTRCAATLTGTSTHGVQAYVIGGVADKGRLVNASLLRAHQSPPPRMPPS